MKQFTNLQGLRALGFLFIFLHHTLGYITKASPVDFGGRGVEIFFVLSGFLIAYHSMDKDLVSTWKGSLQYLLKKLKKFYVLHIFTFLILALFFLHRYMKSGHIEYGDWYHFILNAVLNITLLQSWYSPAKFSFNGVTWFLSSILFMYFLTPKSVNFLKRRGYIEIITLFILIFTFKFMLDTSGYKLFGKLVFFSSYVNPAYRFLDFLIGYLGYVTFFKSGNELNISKRSTTILQLIVLSMYLGSCYIFNKIWQPAPFILLTILLIFACALKGGIMDYILGNKLMVHIGNISLELFIFHQVIIRILGPHIIKYFSPLFTIGALFAISLLIAEALHWEKIRRAITIR